MDAVSASPGATCRHDRARVSGADLDPGAPVSRVIVAGGVAGGPRTYGSVRAGDLGGRDGVWQGLPYDRRLVRKANLSLTVAPTTSRLTLPGCVGVPLEKTTTAPFPSATLEETSAAAAVLTVDIGVAKGVPSPSPWTPAMGTRKVLPRPLLVARELRQVTQMPVPAGR